MAKAKTNPDVRGDAATDPHSIFAGAAYHSPMRFYHITATGEIARDLLAFYNREPKPGEKGTNRKHSTVRVVDYTSRMLRGEWHESPQPVVISELNDRHEYELEDGQQRLMALVEADKQRPGITIPLTICTDSPLMAKFVIDTGKPKSPADFLRMQGYINSTPLSHAARVLYCYYHVSRKVDNDWDSFKWTAQVQQNFVADNPSLIQAVQSALAPPSDVKVYGRMPLLFQPYLGAAIWFIIAKEYDVFVAENFLDGLKRGIQSNDARESLRRYLSVQKENRHRWGRYEQLALLISTANAWLNKEESYRVRRPSTVRFPRLIPKDDLPHTLDSLFSS